MEERYGDAYASLSDRDRRNIPPEGFARWQSSVARSYHIEEFSIITGKQYDRFPMGDAACPAIRYSVEILERDLRSGESARYRLVKFVVEEKAGWRVHLGYRDIGYVVEQFSQIAGVSGDDIARCTEPMTGLPNRHGFIEKCRPEAYRCTRYGRKCALGIASLQYVREPSDLDERRRLHQQAAFSLRAAVRLIDVVGVLEDGRFCVLLAETDAREARRALPRIVKKVEQDIFACFDTRISLHCALDDYHGENLDNALRALEQKNKRSAQA